MDTKDLLVVKIGGELLKGDVTTRLIIEQLTLLIKKGYQLVIVHGGGKQLDTIQNQLGIKAKKIDGLRVTLDDDIDALLMGLCGFVNKQLVQLFSSYGNNVVGLSGIDGNLFIAEKIINSNYDLGFVGEIKDVNIGFVNLFLSSNITPIIAPVSLSEENDILNVNADMAALALSVALKSKLIILSNVDGVLDSEGKVIPILNNNEIERLISEKIVTDGMIPKLRSAVKAVADGAKSVLITNGASISGLINITEQENAIGTTIV